MCCRWGGKVPLRESSFVEEMRPRARTVGRWSLCHRCGMFYVAVRNVRLTAGTHPRDFSTRGWTLVTEPYRIRDSVAAKQTAVI